jgi:hypothetical protein
MGAWDVGMRSNDSALDAIYVFRERINRMPIKAKGALLLLQNVATKFGRSPDVTLCVLGVAEALLDQNVSLSLSARQYLIPWIGRAIAEIRMQHWDDPDMRTLAIGRFARRLMGERISTINENSVLFEGTRNLMKLKI